MAKKFSEEELLAFCRDELANMMGVEPGDIHIHANFEDLRLNSIHAMQMLDELDLLGIALSPIIFWVHPSLSSFCKRIATHLKS